MSDKPADTKTDATNTKPGPEAEVDASAILEVAGVKKPTKSLYMVLYYLMIAICLAVIGIGTSTAMTSGFAGHLNFSLGVAYFGMAIVLLCLALYFRSKAIGNSSDT